MLICFHNIFSAVDYIEVTNEEHITQYLNNQKSDYRIITSIRKTSMNAWVYYYFDTLNTPIQYKIKMDEIISEFNSSDTVHIILPFNHFTELKKKLNISYDKYGVYFIKQAHRENLVLLINRQKNETSNELFSTVLNYMPNIDYSKKINYSNQIEFLGYDLDYKINNKTRFDIYNPSSNWNKFKITYYWKSLKPINESYKVFVHFLNESGDVVFQDDHEPFYGLYNTNEWKAGEIIKETYNVYIWDNIKPDKYYIKVGLYNENRRLAIANQNYEIINQTPEIQNTQSIIYNNTFEFLGYDLDKTKIEEEKFEITYYWKSLKETDKDYTIFVHFLNESGKTAFQNDHNPPVPTSNWTVGQILKEIQTVYDKMHDTALLHLKRGEDVVLESMYFKTQREQAIELTIKTNLPYKIIEIVCTEMEIEKRLAKRKLSKVQLPGLKLYREFKEY